LPKKLLLSLLQSLEKFLRSRVALLLVSNLLNQLDKFLGRLLSIPAKRRPFK